MKIYLSYSMLLMLTSRLACAGAINIGLDNHDETVNADWGNVAHYTQVSIALQDGNNSHETNQPIEISVRIKNLSTNETYGFFVDRTITNNTTFSVSVISPSGKNIAPVFSKSDIASGASFAVKPRQIHGFRFYLTDICKLEEVGTYKVVVTVHRRSNSDNKVYDIASNQLLFNIVSHSRKAGP